MLPRIRFENLDCFQHGIFEELSVTLKLKNIPIQSPDSLRFHFVYESQEFLEGIKKF
jgi:hypothetical protein